MTLVCFCSVYVHMHEEEPKKIGAGIGESYSACNTSYAKIKTRIVKGYLSIETSITLRKVLCWCEVLWICIFSPALKMLWKHNYYTPFHPKPAQDSLDSLGLTHFHVGPSSGSSRNTDNTILLFGKR